MFGRRETGLRPLAENGMKSAKAIQKLYDKTSRWYDLLDWPFEKFRYKKIRRMVWHGLKGRILDLGCGTGSNGPFYPSDAKITACDLSWGMLNHYTRRKNKALCLQANVFELPFSDDIFDSIVATFVCCVIENPEQAAKEMIRVLKPGGEIRTLEYVRSQKPWRQFIMRLWRPFVRRLFGTGFEIDAAMVFRNIPKTRVTERYFVSDIIKEVRVQI